MNKPLSPAALRVSQALDMIEQEIAVITADGTIPPQHRQRYRQLAEAKAYLRIALQALNPKPNGSK